MESQDSLPSHCKGVAPPWCAGNLVWIHIGYIEKAVPQLDLSLDRMPVILLEHESIRGL